MGAKRSRLMPAGAGRSCAPRACRRATWRCSCRPTRTGRTRRGIPGSAPAGSSRRRTARPSSRRRCACCGRCGWRACATSRPAWCSTTWCRNASSPACCWSYDTVGTQAYVQSSGSAAGQGWRAEDAFRSGKAAALPERRQVSGRKTSSTRRTDAAGFECAFPTWPRKDFVRRGSHRSRLIPIGLCADLIDGLGDPGIAGQGGESSGFVT